MFVDMNFIGDFLCSFANLDLCPDSTDVRSGGLAMGPGAQALFECMGYCGE